MSQLRGARELRARLRAIKQTFKPAGRSWADEVVRLARPHIPSKTGRTRASVKVRNASMKKATVAARFPAVIIDTGQKPHDIRARKARTLRFTVGGRPRFAKRVHHPATAPRPYRQKVARQALDRHPLAEELVKLWNAAA